MTLGRSRTCTVPLQDPAASRSHAQLILAAGTVRARDLQSSNGTYLNGERLEAERLLAPGDRLTIGETDLVLRVEAPQEVGATVRLGADDIARLEPPQGEVTGPVPAASAAEPSQPAAEAGSAPAGARSEGWAQGELGQQPVTPREPPQPSPPSGPSAPASGASAPAPTPSPPAPAPREAPAIPPVQPQTPPSPAAPQAPMPAPPPTPQPRAEPPRPIAPTRPPMAAAVAPVAAPAVAAPDLPPPGGFLARAVAVVIDGVWMTALALLASIFFGGPLATTGAAVSAATLLFLGFAVPVLGWWLWGATPGKAVLGLSVRSLDGAVPITLGRALARWLATWVSSALFGIGFLMVAFSANRRALHDLAAGTYVARRR